MLRGNGLFGLGIRRELFSGALVHAGEAGFELVEARVNGSADSFDFLSESEEAGVNLIANGCQLLVELGFGGERFVAAAWWENFFVRTCYKKAVCLITRRTILRTVRMY